MNPLHCLASQNAILLCTHFFIPFIYLFLPVCWTLWALIRPRDVLTLHNPFIYEYRIKKAGKDFQVQPWLSNITLSKPYHKSATSTPFLDTSREDDSALRFSAPTGPWLWHFGHRNRNLQGGGNHRWQLSLLTLAAQSFHHSRKPLH